MKKVVTTIDKAEKTAEFHSHFGYQLAEIKEKGDHKHITLIFNRPITKNTKEFNSLEKEYKTINKKFPTAAFVWGIFGSLFLIIYFLLAGIATTKLYAFIAIPFFVISYALSLFFLVIFIVLQVYKGKLLKDLYLKGDRLSGKVKDIPCLDNVAPSGEHSNMIEMNIETVI